MVIVTDAPPVSVFTPPSSCSSHWTYEDSIFNSVPGGLMLQNALPTPLDSDCFQSDVTVYGRLSHVEFNSPGACPVGYTTPVQSVNDGTTSIICCQSSFSYISTTTTYTEGSSKGQEVFAGCISTLPYGDTTAIPSYDTNSHLSAFATIEGPISMWAQPLQFAFQKKDLSLFTTSSSAMTTTTGAQTPMAATTMPTAMTSSLSTSTPTPVVNAGLSSGAKAGIGVGVTLGVLALILAGVFAFLLRRRKQKAMGRGSPVQGSMISGPMAQAPGGYAYQENQTKHYPMDAPVDNHWRVEAGDSPVHLDGNPRAEMANTEIPDTRKSPSWSNGGR